MVFKLENIVLWGRSLSEYRKMFALSDRDLKLSIVDCGGGPASFNVEMSKLGYRVVSCDPIYRFSTAAVERRIEETSPVIIKGLNANRDRFVWQEIETPEQLAQQRLSTMKLFLSDYELENISNLFIC